MQLRAAVVMNRGRKYVQQYDMPCEMIPPSGFQYEAAQICLTASCDA